MSDTKIHITISAAAKGLQGTFGKSAKAIKAFSAEMTRTKKTVKSLNDTSDHLRSTILGLATAFGGIRIFKAAATSAFSFNQIIEQSRIGIAALVRTFKHVDMAKSFEIAIKIQKRLQIAGLKTVATYQQLLVALQEGIGPALADNFNPAQIVKFTSAMTQAAAAISLPMDQLGQELRAILNENINRNARVAVTLHITNADVKKWKAEGQLFEKLQDHLKAFAAAGDQSAATMAGAWSNVQDAIQMALGMGTQKSFRATTIAIMQLQKSIVHIDTAAGTFTFNKKIMSALDGIDKKIAGFLHNLTPDQIVAGLQDIVQGAGAVVDVGMDVITMLKKAALVIGPYAGLLIRTAGDLLILSAAFKALSFAFLAPLKLLRAFDAGMLVLTGSRLLPWLASAKIALSAVASEIGIMSLAFKGFVVFADAQGIMNIIKLISVIHEWRTASESSAKSSANAAAAQQKFQDKLKKISSESGVVVKSFAEMRAAFRENKIEYNALTDTYSKGSGEIISKVIESSHKQVEITTAALAEMKKKYRVYVNEIKNIIGEIAVRQQSLTEELRAMSRTGMSDLGAWRDRKKEAEEYYRAAQKAAAAGNFKAAISLADKAKSAYKDLNKEVKAGNTVQVSAATGLKTAMDGVKSAGELAIAILKKQKTAAEKAAKALDDKAGGKLSGKIKDQLDKVDKLMQGESVNWGKVWQAMNQDAAEKTKIGMQKVDREIMKIVRKNRVIYIDVVRRDRKSLGGIVSRLAMGGRLAGYGGGDRIPALLEAGEFIMRKESVRHFGAGIFRALNNLQLPELPKFAAGGPVSAPNVTENSAGAVTINFSFPSGAVVGPFQGTRALIRELDRERRSMALGASA